MGFTDKPIFFKMNARNGFSFGIFTSLITFCLGIQCGTKLSLNASTEPTLYPSNRMHVKNMFQCDTACRRDPSCVSVNYDYQNKFCDLNTFPQKTYNSHSQAKNYLRKHCQDEDNACDDCGRDRRCVHTAEGFKCIHDDVTTPLAVVDCGPPGVVPNGNVNYNTTTYSSQAQIVCNTGYNFSDVNDTISCTANGTWDFLFGSCQPVDCGTPARVYNGISLYNSTKYGSVCYVACNPGFTGLNETITCRAGGYWENVTTSCQAVSCGSPPRTPFGTYNYSSTTYGSLSHLLCKTGYSFNGTNSTVTCRADGTWDSISGLCEAVICGSPPDTPFGTYNYSSTTYGSLSHLLCKTGYRFNGTNSTVTCRADGTWDSLLGSCEVVNCGSPGAIPNGVNNCSSNTTTFGSQCQLTCNTGYSFIGANSTITCSDDGTWGTYSGSCAVICGSPPDTPFGTYNYSSTTYGSLSHLLCKTGYRFNGTNSTVTCRADGTWDSLLGSCEVVNCGSPGAIPNGVNNCSSNTTTFGSQCQLTCNTGYSFIGANSTITCSDDGTWGTYSGSCVVECGIPTVENAVVLYNATIHGSRVKVTCVNETSMYDGDAWVDCNEYGKWARLPFCRKNVVTLGDWVLLFRVKAGNGISMYDVWRNETIYHDHPVVPEDLQPGCISLDTSLQCDIHFKSKLVTPTSWITSNIQQVKVLILKSNEVKAEVLFNGQGTTWKSWFSKTHLISSPWTDLTSTSRTNKFSIQGHEKTERRFYINRFFGNCRTDKGWMLIKDKTEMSYCDWERKFDLPAILFSEATNKTFSRDFQSADVMAVLAKLE